MKKNTFLLYFLLFLSLPTSAQFTRGTTGLINMPTADMQRDKTFMAGGGWLNTHATVPRWWYNTFNYYINVTIFPWLEVGYTCTLFKAVPKDYGNGGRWVPYTYGKFVNQDRSFHARLRLWKEGWWKEWTPQVVLGSNEAVSNSSEGGSIGGAHDQTGNGFWARYYLAITKHIEFEHIGTLGAHIAWIYSDRFDNPLNDPAIGANFQFGLDTQGEWWRKEVNKINVMAEIVPGYTEVIEAKDAQDLRFDPNGPKYSFNVGMEYAIWKESITAVMALNRCQHFSAGVVFKVHLK